MHARSARRILPPIAAGRGPGRSPVSCPDRIPAGADTAYRAPHARDSVHSERAQSLSAGAPMTVLQEGVAMWRNRVFIAAVFVVAAGRSRPLAADSSELAKQLTAMVVAQHRDAVAAPDPDAADRFVAA